MPEFLARLRAWLRIAPPTASDFEAWRKQLGLWAAERRSEIIYATWTGDRE